MKKFAIAVATASMLAGAHAESCASAFSGFYAGVQAGLANTTGNLTISDYYSTTAETAGGTIKNVTCIKSFVAGLFGGYGMGVGSCAYVGAELYANFDTANGKLYDTTNADSDARTFKITLKRKFNLGAKVRLGYTVSQQAMIFLGLGLEYAKLQLKSENVQTTTAQTGITQTVSKNTSKISFAPSVGMDIFVNKNLFLRGEYTYVVGLNQKITPGFRTATPKNTTATVKSNATQQRFTLGLGYKF